MFKIKAQTVPCRGEGKREIYPEHGYFKGPRKLATGNKAKIGLANMYSPGPLFICTELSIELQNIDHHTSSFEMREKLLKDMIEILTYTFTP